MNVKSEIINIDEIPSGGQELAFELDPDSVNERLNLNKGLQEKSTLLRSPPSAKLHVEVSGLTVLIKGSATLSAEDYCSRCGESTNFIVNPPIRMVLKPKRSKDEEEDLNIGYYTGKEINLAPIVEEQLILGLPYRVLCKPDCLGLCVECGENLNISGRCNCCHKDDSKPGTFKPFADLRGKIKV